MGINGGADKATPLNNSPKQRMRIGSWNVQTMYQAGKVHQVAKAMHIKPSDSRN